MEFLGGGFFIAIVLLGLVVAVLWILLPFAVFGSKDLLRELIREQRKTNALLQAQAARVPTALEQEPTLRADR